MPPCSRGFVEIDAFAGEKCGVIFYCDRNNSYRIDRRARAAVLVDTLTGLPMGDSVVRWLFRLVYGSRTYSSSRCGLVWIYLMGKKCGVI